VLALLLLAACGDDAIAPATYVLSDGTTVDVAPDGSFDLVSADGHALASSVAPPSSTAFDSVVQFNFGFFTFRRTNALDPVIGRFTGSELAGDVVTLDWSAGESRFRTEISVHRAGEATRVRWSVEGAPEARSMSIAFGCDGASFAGFGAQYDDTDQKGDAFPLFVEEQGIGRTGTGFVSGNAHTTYFPMPYWLDWRGFGVLIDTPSRVLVDLCSADPSRATVEVEHTAPFDVLVFHGPTPKDVIRELGDEVGRAPSPPPWAFSPWIGMQGGRAAVLDEVAALEAAGVPFSAVWVQDWVGGERVAGDIYDLKYRWIADETLYPDLAGMVATLRADHDVRFLAYANSFVDREGPHFADMRDQGLLIETAAGEPYTFAIVSDVGSMADFTNPATHEYVKGFLRAMVGELGFDGWMSDFGEWLPLDAVLHEGDARLLHNLYPALWHRASREVMDELRPDGDWVIFSRSGWTRDHAEHQIVWLGDQEADFLPTDGLPTVVPALVNSSLSGVPFVTHDIAGYSGGPSTKELYLRWTELGAFSPIMRTHEGLMPATNWNWDRDAETTAHFRRFARVHEILAPELLTLAAEASSTSLPIVRHLALEFPDDAASRAVHDQFLLGPTLLIAPVVEEGVTRRSVYLPPGTWFHVWTGTEHAGGTTIEVDAPIGSPPVFSLGVDRPELRTIE
jgi:alpha-glucosidase